MGIYFYQSRFYDPWLGRFLQADTIVPEPGNPQAWDRYAYVLNNAVKYIDPSGHWLIESESSSQWSKKNVVLPNRKKALSGWELRLGAMTVGSESSNGYYPFDAMLFTAWIILNCANSGNWNSFAEIAENFGYPELWEKNGGDLPNPPKNHTGQDFIDYINQTWEMLINGSNKEGWKAALEAMQTAHNQWRQSFGDWNVNDPTNGSIYMSHQNSPVDHETIEARHAWIIATMQLRASVDSAFRYGYVGPFYSSTQGFWVLLIGSNVPVCGTEGYCGPPWP